MSELPSIRDIARTSQDFREVPEAEIRALLIARFLGRPRLASCLLEALPHCQQRGFNLPLAGLLAKGQRFRDRRLRCRGVAEIQCNFGQQTKKKRYLHQCAGLLEGHNALSDSREEAITLLKCSVRNSL